MKPEEGPGQCCDGAREHQLFSARDDGVPCERSTGTGLHGWGRVSAEQCSSPPRQHPWLAKSKQAEGLGLAGPVRPVHAQGSRPLRRSCAAAGRQGDAWPAQLSLLCQGS